MLLIIPLTTRAQFQFDFVTDIPVIIVGDTLRNPWAGGLNAGQYSTIDLDLDGKDDLVVFDRTSGKLNTFLSQDDRYVYAPAYEAQFPPDLRNWMLLVDYNCDGRPDIFTSASGGIRVFENTSDEALSFTLVADPVTTESGDDPFNLQVNTTDIPGIVDVDGDGDLDILTFDFAAGSTIEYHQNQSQETDGTCNNLNFRRITRRWGDFAECNCGIYAFGDEECAPANGRSFRTQHVGGKSILALDTDGDGDQDLVFGDETCSSLAFLINEGSSESALFRAASDTFPVATEPAQGFFFPAAYQLTATGDAQPNVVVAPNVFSNLQQSIDMSASSWLYRNVGTAEQARYELIQRDFLQDEMIDLGAYAAPALGDYDGDGDYDLLLGAEQTQGQARLQLYENVGTSTVPAFRLVEEDYLGLSAEGFTDIKPVLADINSDGRVDLILQTSGTGVLAQLRYLINQSADRWNFAPPLRSLGISMVDFDTPFFSDIDQDGHVDLLIGRVTGRLEYLRNDGEGSMAFTLQTDSLAGIKNNPFRRSLTPWVGDLDGDGTRELLTTDGSGVMRVYEDFLSENPTVTAQLVRYGDDPAQESRLGLRTWLAGVDLLGTGRPMLVVGHAQGGIYLLKATDDSSGQAPTTELLTLAVFPNPAVDPSEVKVTVSHPAQLTVYDALGRRVLNSSVRTGLINTLSTRGLAQGVYTFRAVSSDGRTAVQRLIVP